MVGLAIAAVGVAVGFGIVLAFKTRKPTRLEMLEAMLDRADGIPPLDRRGLWVREKLADREQRRPACAFGKPRLVDGS